MTVLVTGGSGFVGEAIIVELLKNNFNVVALVNRNSARGLDSPPENGLSVMRADIRNFENLKSLPVPEKIDVLIHTAGLAHQFGERDARDFWEINVEGAKNIAELAVLKSVRQFILISSVAVYGNARAHDEKIDGGGLNETAECRPEGVYAQTKLESENVVRQICGRNRVNLIVLRLATVIGENDRGNVARLIKTIDRGRFVWIGTGKNLKSLIYKNDVARACLKFLQNQNAEGVYNVTADALPMREIVIEIQRRLGKKESRFSIAPAILAQIFALNRRTLNHRKIGKLAETVRKWLADDVFSGAKFKKEYDFQIETPIREAVGREVESYLQSK